MSTSLKPPVTDEPPEVPGYRCALCGGFGWIDKPHVHRHLESEHCWCIPTLDYVAENGTKVWVHHEPN